MIHRRKFEGALATLTVSTDEEQRSSQQEEACQTPRMSNLKKVS